MAELKEIIARFGPGLRRVAAAYERDRALQEDLVQEIFLALHVALPQLREIEKLPAFVFRIAHNRAAAHVMRQVADKRAIDDDDAEAPASIEDGLIEAERAQRLMKAVRRLPLPYRQVVMLLLEDLSHAEIGEALGLTPNNVGVRINRAKQMLKELLGDE